MATKPSGGTDLHPERSGRAAAPAEDGEGRRFCFAMESGPKGRAGKSSAAAIADPARLTADRPLEGRGAVLSEG